MNRPSFFILGTSKAGTTSLHYYLSQHPDILMSDPKEPPFFRLEYARGPEYYWRTYFRRWSGQRAAGDGAPQNLYLPFVAPRIAATAPDARLVVLCRNPVDRAVSAWSHNARVGNEALPFEEAIERNLRRMREGPRFEDEAGAAEYARVYAESGSAGLERTFGFYVEPGYYADAIERYASLFGRERMKILFFEDLTRDSGGVTAEVVRFLDLEPRPLGDERIQNEATSSWAARVMGSIARLPGVQRISPEWRTRARRGIAGLGRVGQSAPQVSAAARRELHQHFREPNARLAALTGRNLAAWNVPRPD
jgi:hypothetical protein